MTASLARLSALVNVRPAVILAELSGPTVPADNWVPATVNELVLNDEEDPAAPPDCAVPPDWLADGIVPETDRSVRTSAPPAAATPCRAEIEPADDAVSVPSWPDISVSRLNFVPALGIRLAARGPPTRKAKGPPDSAEAAVTVITSPIPTARPSAAKTACFIRRRSSRRRYVKNIQAPQK